MKLQQKVTFLSKRKGLSLTKLAGLSGGFVQTIRRWTAGRKPVNLEQLKQVATVLEVSPQDGAYKSSPFGGLFENNLPNAEGTGTGCEKLSRTDSGSNPCEDSRSPGSKSW